MILINKTYYTFSYMEKLTEFLQLFITNHLKRVESCPKFPVNTLLEVLCHHTFQQCSTVTGYLRCLDVWTTLLESSQSRYSPVALALAERVLQKMSFKLNPRMLKDLDTESLDENVRKFRRSDCARFFFYGTLIPIFRYRKKQNGNIS